MTEYSQLVKGLRRLDGELWSTAADAIEDLEARVAELEAGLRPFADFYSVFEGKEGGETFATGGVWLRKDWRQLTVENLRIARALLERNPS